MEIIKKQNWRENNVLFTILFLSVMFSALSHAGFSRDDTTGIVIDNSSNLQWSDNSVGATMTWEAAITHCEDMTLGSYADWRLPNFNELYYLVNHSKAVPAIDSTFQFVVSDLYWSSTAIEGGASSVWTVTFYRGSGHWSNKGNSNYVRCVRGGQ